MHCTTQTDALHQQKPMHGTSKTSAQAKPMHCIPKAANKQTHQNKTTQAFPSTAEIPLKQQAGGQRPKEHEFQKHLRPVKQNPTMRGPQSGNGFYPLGHAYWALIAQRISDLGTHSPERRQSCVSAGGCAEKLHQHKAKFQPNCACDRTAPEVQREIKQ